MIAFRSPVLRPLHPKEWVRPAGSIDFRVTQQFDDLDFYNQSIPGAEKKYHRATDIGNTRCDGAVVAMAPGRAYRLRDNASAVKPPPGELPWTDALGVRIDHGQGLTSEYWHLNAYAIGSDGVQVQAGQQIGTVGKTGLLRVCHLHVEMKVNGQRIDPEPHMFGAPWPLLIPDTGTGEDDVPHPLIQTLPPSAARLKGPTDLRKSPERTDTNLHYQVPQDVVIDLEVLGKFEDERGLWYLARRNTGGALFFVPNSGLVAPPVALPPPVMADCEAQVQQATAALVQRTGRAKVALDAIAVAANAAAKELG